MKFLTENDIRQIEKNIGLEEFTLGEKEKLTPGARSYLMDRGIRLTSNKEKSKKNRIIREKNFNLDYLEAVFFKLSYSLLSYNNIISKEIFDYGKLFNSNDGLLKSEIISLFNIDEETCEEAEIEFEDIQSEEGKIVVEINYLKALLNREKYLFDEEEVIVIEFITKRLSKIIKMIIGVEPCQKNN